jgi:uncharacterized protein (TIGR00645 family)
MTSKKFLENVIFNVKWILPIFYFGLVVVLFLYGFAYLKEIVHLISRTNEVSTDEMKIMVLDMIDIVMVANLVKMIITGSYNSFITKSHGVANENISSGMLKVKISSSVITVASIHLLKIFMTNTENAATISTSLEIFAMFLLCSLVLGSLEYLHVKAEVLESSLNHQEKP